MTLDVRFVRIVHAEMHGETGQHLRVSHFVAPSHHPHTVHDGFSQRRLAEYPTCLIRREMQEPCWLGVMDKSGARTQMALPKNQTRTS